MGLGLGLGIELGTGIADGPSYGGP